MKEVPQLIYSILNRYFPFFKHFLNLEDFFHTRQENEHFLSDPQGASEIYTYIRDTYIVHMLSIAGGICEQLCSAINRPGPDKFRSQYILYQQREEESWRERVLKSPVNLPWTFLIPDCVSVCVCAFLLLSCQLMSSFSNLPHTTESNEQLSPTVASAWAKEKTFWKNMIKEYHSSGSLVLNIGTGGLRVPVSQVLLCCSRVTSVPKFCLCQNWTSDLQFLSQPLWDVSAGKHQALRLTCCRHRTHRCTVASAGNGWVIYSCQAVAVGL